MPDLRSLPRTAMRGHLVLISGFPFDFAQGGESFDIAQDLKLFDFTWTVSLSNGLSNHGLRRNDNTLQAAGIMPLTALEGLSPSIV